MKFAAISLAGAVAGLIGLGVMMPPAGAADPAPSPTAQYGTPAKPAGEGKEAQPAPRRKPSPPVAGQSARGPAFKGECVWVGKRIVNLLSRDDAMAANDFMPFYGQFGCPQEHLAKAFGCVVTNTDPYENEALADRIDACWDDPAAEVPQKPKPAAAGGTGASDGQEQRKEGAAPAPR